jgi:hypothetical protein
MGYNLALGNAILFFLLSFLTLQFRFPIQYSVYVSTLYFVGCAAASSILILSGGALSCAAYYVLGSGIFFGFGTAYSTTMNDLFSNAYFPKSLQISLLPYINLLNSVSASIVLLVARPLCIQEPEQNNSYSTFRHTISLFKPIMPIAFLLAFIHIFLELATFPSPHEPLLRTLIGYMQGLAFCAVLAAGATWSTAGLGTRIAAIAIAVIQAAIGILAFSKLQTMLPLGAMVVGLLLDGRAKRAASVAAVVALAVYVFLAIPVSAYGRVHPNFNGVDNTIVDRVGMMSYALDLNAIEHAQGRSDQGQYFTRFVAAPIQAFLITQHDSGNAGDTISQGWMALVPRVFWPEKPNITRYGTELDGQVYRRANSTSALAPSYTGEAYWNGGWVGVLIVSILLGLEIGWLTRKWVRFTREGMSQAGIFVFGVPTVLFGLWVENWIIPTYVGGFATLFVLISATDIAIRKLAPMGPYPRRTTVAEAGRAS